MHHLKGGIVLPPENVVELYHPYKESILKKYTKERDHHPINSLEEFIIPHLLAGEGKPMSISDKTDVDYLASHLTTEQLRREIHNADIQEGVARLFAKDEDATYWHEFGQACQLAMNAQRSNRPKREVGKGQLSVGAIKDAHDIVDVISRYTDLRKVGKEYIGRCPFHQDEHPSLHVSQEKQLFYCFSCQRKGDVVNFIMQIEDLDTKQACLFLGT